MDAIVKKNDEANLEHIEENNYCEHSSPKSVTAIVLAVHDTNVRPNTLSAVLAPKTEVKNVEKEWGSKGEVFQKRLRSNDEVYFCVPLSEQKHLPLRDNVVRFLPDAITRTYNNTEDGMNLGDKDKRFLLQPCVGRNHFGNYCYAQVRIKPWMKPKTTSGNQILIATTPGMSLFLVEKDISQRVSSSAKEMKEIDEEMDVTSTSLTSEKNSFIPRKRTLTTDWKTSKRKRFAANQDFSINKLNLLTRQKICRKLDIRQELGGDFREFAAKIDMSNDDLNIISQNQEPTQRVLMWWGQKREATVKELRRILETMKREDVLEILDQGLKEEANTNIRKVKDDVDAKGSHTRAASTETDNRVVQADELCPLERELNNGVEKADKDVSSNGADKNLKKVLHMKEHCELFEKNFNVQIEDKLKIGDLIKYPRNGKTTETVNVICPVNTVVASLACGVAVALDFTTVEVGSSATVLAVSENDKSQNKENAKVIQRVSKSDVSSVMKSILKEVGKELSRIFEYQLFMLKDERQLEIVVCYALDLMFNLKDGDTFDRNTLLRKVLTEKIGKKKELTTRDDKINWSVPDMFRKPGLRKATCATRESLKSINVKYLVKPDDTCDVPLYRYRNEMLEMKFPTSTDGKGSPTMRKNGSCNACADCSSDTPDIDGTYFVASDIDEEYTEPSQEQSNYQFLHCLVQCPKILECFACNVDKECSLAKYVGQLYNLPANQILKPVYRPHSPRRVPVLTKANLQGCDFSRANFTGCNLEGCDLSECTIFFAKFDGLKLRGSKLVETHFSICNLKHVQARCCSNVIADDDTNMGDALTDNSQR